jgi:TolA-binding protein
MESLARRSGRELAAEADAELKAARRKDGLGRAHGLEDFVTRYPRHPQADNALVEAAAAYADAGRADAACTVARRAAEEYPAGDATSDALWRVAACESQRGAADAEKRILSRLVTEYPSTPAARRAGERLAAISGRTGGDSPADVPARSGP